MVLYDYLLDSNRKNYGVVVTSTVDLIQNISPLAQKYITLKRVNTSQTYNYAARGFYELPVIDTVLHAPKCSIGESWLYFAIPSNIALNLLKPDDRLYIGAQTQDRMFRGDGLGGNNFHHAEIRAGNGADTPVAFLKSGREVTIYRVNAFKIEALLHREVELASLKALLNQKRTAKKHLSWWFEQYVLYSEPTQWRWNTDPASKEVSALFSPRRSD